MKGLFVIEILILIVVFLLSMFGVDRYILTMVTIGALSLISFCEIKRWSR